jgi:hypothetical protein
MFFLHLEFTTNNLKTIVWHIAATFMDLLCEYHHMPINNIAGFAFE